MVPAGAHDDQVDVLSLFGRMLDSMYGRAGLFDNPGWDSLSLQRATPLSPRIEAGVFLFLPQFRA